ncbi:hypothetical protein MTR67_012853 [Solanum verrucosum]|uniref:Reverse transcriptase zinc-binding domain-containing protein n=1 Tax=Solanum verrucosum TaxID=315347 RepID=A0AAF0QAG4_SOLVR|nr:hypothetical protein MTR67_012853 [Solanum verrucosum]
MEFTVRRLLHDWELERVVEFFKTLKSFQGFKDIEDSLIWKPTGKGTNSVNSAYSILIRHRQSTNQWPWRSIWKMKAPFKVFKDAGGFEALVTGKTTDVQCIDVNERIISLEKLNPTPRPSTSPNLEGRWNFEWFGAGSPVLLFAKFLFGRIPPTLANLSKLDVLIKDGCGTATAQVKILNSEGPWKTKEVTSTYGTSLWRSIRNLWHGFYAKTECNVNNGRKIRFWEDNWLGNGSLKRLFPDIHHLNQQQESTLYEVWSEHGWNLTYRRLMQDWEVERLAEFYGILDQFLGFKEGEDTLKWKCHNKGRTGQALESWNMEGSGSTDKSRWKIVPAVIWWTVWKERNSRNFDNKSIPLHKIKMNCIITFCYWCSSEYIADPVAIVDILGSL